MDRRLSRARPRSLTFLGCRWLGVLVIFQIQAVQADPGDILTGQKARFSGEVGRQVAQLQAAWSEHGQSEPLSPVLSERGGNFVVPLGAEALDPVSEECATVALVAAPNVSFMVSFGERENSPVAERHWPVTSSAGIVQITRCGARKRFFAELTVQMRSRRGVVDGLVLVSKVPPPSATELLKGRDPGPMPPSPEVGQRPYLRPLQQRVDSKKSSQRLQQPAASAAYKVESDRTGRGARVLSLSPGCHRFLLLAPQDKASPPDLDGVLFETSKGALLDHDDEQAGEVKLEHCTASSQRVRLELSGANPTTEITILHDQFPLPRGIPENWGTEARRLFASAFLGLSLPDVQDEPLVSKLGVRGETRTEIPTVPGECFLIAAVPIRGESRRLQLRTFQGVEERRTQGLEPNQGTALTFCSRSFQPIEIGLNSIGVGIAWVMGVWQIPKPSVQAVTPDTP